MVENKKDLVEEAIEKAKPVLAKISFGAVMGYCSGIALKKVGKMLAFIVGLGFIGLQTAQSTGYLAVDWSKIVDDLKMKADTNDDGGIDGEDVKVSHRLLCLVKVPLWVVWRIG